jgi:hypothetical protein
MVAILQKSFLDMKPGEVFHLKEHKEKKGLHIFEVDHIDITTGERFWLTKEFVLGQFEDGYSPLCWTDDLFVIV